MANPVEVLTLIGLLLLLLAVLDIVMLGLLWPYPTFLEFVDIAI